MEKVGIVRRLDELGRLVIPKEMRRVLHLKEGNYALISINKNNEIIVTKHSHMLQIKDVASNLCRIIGEDLRECVLICDTDKIVAGYGNNFKLYIHKRISEELNNILSYRKSVINVSGGNNSLINIVNDDNLNFKSQIVVPIIFNSDLVGGIILISNDIVPLEYLKIIKISAKFVAEQMD